MTKLSCFPNHQLQTETTSEQASQLHIAYGDIQRSLRNEKKENAIVAAFSMYLLSVLEAAQMEDRKEQVGNTQWPLTLLSTSTCRDGRAHSFN